MGKPAPPNTEPSAAGGSSSLDNSNADTFSLHSNPANTIGFSSGFDDDLPELQNDDLPPLYSDIDAEGGGESSAPLLDAAYSEPRDVVEAYCRDKNTGDVFFMNPFLERPEELLKQINSSASMPPRAHMRVLGTHSAMVDEGGKKKKKTVTDFDVLVEVTPYLFSDATRQKSLLEVRTVENSEKARRGTIFKKRAPGSKQDIEILEDPKPTLKEWCHRYCASSATVKSFTLQRRVLGFDKETMRKQLTDLVRSTNYRGRVQIDLQVSNQYVTVYNNCFVNRSRLTTWIVWFCYLTFLWLLTWPFLFFVTKKFEVVTSDWYFSRHDDNGVKRYASISEDHWYNTWARAIHNAVLLKKQKTLDHNDLAASHSDTPTAIDQALEGAPGFVRTGVQLFTAVHRSIGWGDDTY